MFGRCDLCGGPGTSSHDCPGMRRDCRLCGGYGLGDITHICPGLRRDCRLCGGHGLGDVTHICPGLSRPCGRCGQSSGSDYTHVCLDPNPPPTISFPQVTIVTPTVIQVPQTVYWNPVSYSPFPVMVD